MFALGLSAGVLVLVGLFLRAFLFRVYRVDSGSMEPTLFGSAERGESVIVEFDDSTPERFETIVLRGPGGAYVKRAVGLPGERVELRHGDLVVDGRRLGPEVPRPLFPVLFDSRWHPIEDDFILGAQDQRPWTPGDSGLWLLDALEIPEGDRAGLLYFHRNATDDYLDADHRIVRGQRVVNDLVVEADLRVVEVAAAGGIVRLGLHECADTFEATLRFSAEGDEVTASLTRRNRPDQLEVLAETRVTLPLNSWLKARFANVDDCLLLTLLVEGLDVGAGESGLGASYAGNVFASTDLRREGLSYVPRVHLGGEGVRLELARLRIERDLYYTPRDRWGVEEPVQLGVDQLFVLGDNSAHSRDSREFGPVSISDVVGRPRWVVWPWAVRRTLPDPRLLR